MDIAIRSFYRAHKIQRIKPVEPVGSTSSDNESVSNQTSVRFGVRPKGSDSLIWPGQVRQTLAGPGSASNGRTEPIQYPEKKLT